MRFAQGPLQRSRLSLLPSRVQGAFVAVRNHSLANRLAVSAAVSGLLYNQFGYVAVGVFSGVVTLGAAVCIFIMKEPAGDQFGHERQPAELEPEGETT